MLQSQDTEYYYFKETEITDIREIQLQEKMLECQLMKLELFSYKETAKLWEEKARKSEQLCSTLKHQVDFWNSTSEFWKNTSDYFEERYDFLKEQASNLSKKES